MRKFVFFAFLEEEEVEGFLYLLLASYGLQVFRLVGI